MILNQLRIGLFTGIVAVLIATISIAHAGSPQTHVVEIKNFEFTPSELTLSAGDRVMFINKDIVPHTATADDKSWDTGQIAKDQSQTIGIVSNITLTYFCLYHPIMKGRFSYAQ